MNSRKSMTRIATALLLIGMLGAGWIVAALAQEEKKKEDSPTGYTDTPFIPGSKWRVHDDARPRPPVVTPGTASTPEQAGLAPSDAVVLFDGKDLSHWVSEKDGSPAPWKVENGYVEAVLKAGNIRSKDAFGDCQLHVEFATPSEVVGKSQGRGNGGIFLMGKFEIQVLDSYNNLTYADGEAGAIYGQHPPLVNAVRKPGEWQAYDIIFEAPRFEGKKLVRPAYATVLLNGVIVQNHSELLGPTAHKKLLSYEPLPDKLPISLQEHRNPTRFRNIWVRDLNPGKVE